MHSRSCGRSPASSPCPARAFLSLFFSSLALPPPVSPSPFGPLPPAVAFLSSLYVIASRGHLSVRTHAVRRGAARRREVGSRTEHVIEVPICADRKYVFALGRVFSSFLPLRPFPRSPFASLPLRDLGIARRSPFPTARLNETRFVGGAFAETRLWDTVTVHRD